MSVVGWDFSQCQKLDGNSVGARRRMGIELVSDVGWDFSCCQLLEVVSASVKSEKRFIPFSCGKLMSDDIPKF